MQYWVRRYKSGGNSGPGSLNKLAGFKAEVINNFIFNQNVTSIMEFGCGDGNQLRYSQYPNYLGFDISPEAIAECRNLFKNDSSKSFKLLREYNNETAELVLSLDVIYHLIEEEIFLSHMKMLFASSEKYVIIYSSNSKNSILPSSQHIKHRIFSVWIEENLPSWKLIQILPNKYPYNGNPQKETWSDFYFYEKVG